MVRINRYIAQSLGIGRHSADQLISDGKISINGQLANIGDQITSVDQVTYSGRNLNLPKITTIILNKPIGYICSRRGQGQATIYDLLPKDLHHLKPVGRLDKNSSGLLLLTNDGNLAHKLMHPRYQKNKIYEVKIDNPLNENDLMSIAKEGVDIGDETKSKFLLKPLGGPKGNTLGNRIWQASLTEGRNRQIRRTFMALGYKVIRLKRVKFGNFSLEKLPIGKYRYL